VRSIELSEEEIPPRRVAPLVIAAAVLFSLAAFGSWAFLAGHRDAYLHLAGKSSAVGGELRVLIDGEEAYSHHLSGVTGLVDRLVDKQHETFETHIKVAGGAHTIMALLSDAAGGSVYETTLLVDLKPGEIRNLDVLVGEDFGAPLSLKTE
jgi:hypothetical protein